MAIRPTISTSKSQKPAVQSNTVDSVTSEQDICLDQPTASPPPPPCPPEGDVANTSPPLITQLHNSPEQPAAPLPSPPSNLLKTVRGCVAHKGRPTNSLKSVGGDVAHTGRPLNITQIQANIHPLVNQLSSLLRLELFKKSNRPDLSGAHNFIITHRQHFSTLQEIVLNTKDKSDLSSLIQAMENPRLIDVTCWANADQYLTQFPLQQCSTLLMGLRSSQSNATLDPAILARSPQLRNLRMCVFHQDIFSWTFTRRHLHIGGTKDETKQPQKSVNQLCATNPRLVSVSLYGIDNVLVPALLDACDAFRGTLQGLAGISSFGEPSISRLSWNWDMPCLTRLDLEGTIAVYFDLDSLRFCPLLQELRLNIGRKIPPDWDVLHKATQLSQVSSHLRHLDLCGWWALPDSALTQTLLPVLKRLHYLNLMWCTGPTCACFLELMTRLTALTWFGVSATTAMEQDDITNLMHTMRLNMEVDIYRLDQH
ncbi:hypothetical protein BGX26_001691 [Mortierella sp. AD094]|nr:hypothetical protein BGX26_001691 [Mortierella sp. AD094]